MNLPFFIARRYFLSGKKKNFINIISIISMIVVAFGTMSLVIALSVFNGFDGLLRSVYGNFDPDIVIRPTAGKSFKVSEEMLSDLHEIEGVAGVIEVIEDNVLVQYREAQRLVRMKGVSNEFEQYSGIKRVMREGDFALQKDSINYALIGRGIKYDLSLNLANEFYSMQVYYPKNIAPGVINPEQLYTLKSIMPGGIFAIEKFYDENYIFVPLGFAQSLLNYGPKRTSIEIESTEGTDISDLRSVIQERVGTSFHVVSGDELHSDLYKILQIEKLFTFLVFTIIIAIASINLFFSLTMLVIEKKKDIAVLFSQGASSKLIKRIFLYEGYIVSFTGAIIGLFFGLLISYLQQQYGFIGLGMDTAVLQSYPVKIKLMDVLATVGVVIVVTILASIQPAYKASKSFTTNTLQ